MIRWLLKLFRRRRRPPTPPRTSMDDIYSQVDRGVINTDGVKRATRIEKDEDGRVRLK